MIDLLEKVLDAHGGLDRWKKVSGVHSRQTATGQLFEFKNGSAQSPQRRMDVETGSQRVSATPFPRRGSRGEFDHDRVWLENDEGETIDTLTDPRPSFAGHTMETPWTELQALYFATYAAWNYMNVPFILADPDFDVREGEPWSEDGETWRRLLVTFPDRVITHSSEQTFYVNESGHIRRMDYNAEIVGRGGDGAAHYLFGHQNFDGIMYPTRRTVYPRRADNTPTPGPVLVNIDYADYTLT